MNKYYYTVIQTMNDNTQAASATIKDTYDEALAALYYDQWYAIQSENINKCMSIITNESGNQEELAVWSRTIPEPTPEE